MAEQGIWSGEEGTGEPWSWGDLELLAGGEVQEGGGSGGGGGGGGGGEVVGVGV